MAQVVFDHVTKRFDGVLAVNDLDLNVMDGEFLVLVGPSGCGKSTALRCLAGLEEITSGRIIIGERDVTYLDPKDRDIAMVFQNYALYPHMSVRDNMAFGLKLRHMDKQDIRRRVDEAAEILGIAPLLDRKPRALSGGQRQRVALGRAIVREPQCFLMDEPLSNLDAKLRVQTRAEISKLQKRLGTTTVYVTHDQVEAMTMGDRIAVMSAGVLQQLDTPQNLYDHPANRFVATFIGSPAMNIFPGVITANGAGPTITAGDLHLKLPPERAERVMGLSGKPVLVGVRPEHMELLEYSEHAGQGNDIKLPVELVESLGSEALLHVRGPEETIVARVDPRVRLAPGDIADLAVDTTQLHLFDPETDLALL
jgi:multiple sugar transport system ATP-binding protein